MHKEKNKGHSVCMDVNQLTVFCYDCDEFVINDTQDRYLENLRSLVLTRKLVSEEESPAGRSLRVRRKRGVEHQKPILAVKKSKIKPAAPSTPSSLTSSSSSSKKENRDKTVGKKRSPRKRVGLKNLGNTCFMNSVLQSLSNIEEFCNALTRLPSLEYQMKRNKDIKKSVERVISDGVIVTEELKKVLLALKDCDEKGASISTENLFQAIWKVVPRFRGYQQQDAHEFLRYMLDRWDHDRPWENYYFLIQTSHWAAAPAPMCWPQDEDAQVPVQLCGHGCVRRNSPVLCHVSHLQLWQQDWWSLPRPLHWYSLCIYR